MAQDALIKAIEEDANAQCERILKEARHAADEIVRRAEEEALRAREEGVRGANSAVQRKRSSLVNKARTQAASVKIEARQEAIEEVFNETVKRFKEMPLDAYSIILNRLYEELCAVWPVLDAGPPVALVNPRDAGLLGRYGVELSPDPQVSLGVVFISRDGRCRFDNTIDARIKKAKKRLTPELNKILFG